MHTRKHYLELIFYTAPLNLSNQFPSLVVALLVLVFSLYALEGGTQDAVSAILWDRLDWTPGDDVRLCCEIEIA